MEVSFFLGTDPFGSSRILTNWNGLKKTHLSTFTPLLAKVACIENLRPDFWIVNIQLKMGSYIFLLKTCPFSVGLCLLSSQLILWLSWCYFLTNDTKRASWCFEKKLKSWGCLISLQNEGANELPYPQASKHILEGSFKRKRCRWFWHKRLWSKSPAVRSRLVTDDDQTRGKTWKKQFASRRGCFSVGPKPSFEREREMWMTASNFFWAY